MSEWDDREQRQADARAEYERIMTTPSPDPMGAFIESGVIGLVFGEMWRRGVLPSNPRIWQCRSSRRVEVFPNEWNRGAERPGNEFAKAAG